MLQTCIRGAALKVAVNGLYICFDGKDPMISCWINCEVKRKKLKDNSNLLVRTIGVWGYHFLIWEDKLGVKFWNC